MQSARNQRFVFANFEVDRQRGCLARDGEEIALRPKSYGVLLYLLERAGQLVSREELLSAVWPGLVVTDDSLAQCLIELRRALGDDSRSIIRTVPRRGLIFDVPVSLVEPVPLRGGRAPAAPRRWMVPAALAIVAALLMVWWVARPTLHEPAVPETDAQPATPSIAVLRFKDLSPAGDQAWLADSLSEEIMHRLAQSPELLVIARTSSFAVEGQTIAAIARQLNVSHVLEGSLSRQEDNVRVTVQLIDATTSVHVWSKTFVRQFVDMRALQEEIARSVANSLDAGLSDTQSRPDIDPRAHALFLEGRYFYLRRAEGDLARARQRYEEAVAISPQFARAWAGLAAVAVARLSDASQNPAESGEPSDVTALREMQRHAVEQALQFGPTLPEVHIRAAQYYFSTGDRARSLQHVERARSLDPEHWLVRMSLVNELRRAGRIEESIPLVQREVHRDPLNLALRQNLTDFLIWAQRPRDAQLVLNQSLELIPPGPGRSLELSKNIPLLQILLGDFGAAAASIEQLPDGIERYRLLALNQYALGLQAESDATLTRIAAEENTPLADYFVAEVHAYRGDGATALAWLRRIDLGRDCGRQKLAQFVYYSPFLAKLAGRADWEAYRADLLQLMRGCSVGLDVQRDAWMAVP